MATPKDPGKLQEDLIKEQKKTTQKIEKLTATVDGEALDTLKEQLAEEQKTAAAQEKAAKEQKAELEKQTKLAKQTFVEASNFTEQQNKAFGATDAYREATKEFDAVERELNELLYHATVAGDENSIELHKQNLQQFKVQKNYFKNQAKDNIEASKNRIERLNEIKIGVKQRTEAVKERKDRYKQDKEDREKRSETVVEDILQQPGGLRDVTDQIKLNTETANLSVPLIKKQFKELTFLRMDMAGDEGVKGLLDVFNKAQDDLAKGNINQVEMNKIMQEVSNGINDREKQREAEEAAELQNSNFVKMGQALDTMGTKLGDFGGKALKTGGLLAGLVGLVLGVIDPKLLMAIITNLTQGFLELVEGLMAFFQGDFETFGTKIKENLGLFIGIMTGVLLMFGGPLLTTLGGLFTTLGKVVNAMKVFRVFMMGTFIPGMMGAFSSIMGALAPVIAPLLPILAIIAVIAGAFYFLKNSLGEGATIMDTIKYGALMLIDALSAILNGITFIPRKIFQFLGGGRLARWIFGDEVGDMVDNFLGEGFKTNRSAEFKEDLQARENKKKRDANLVAEAEAEGVFDDELVAAGLGITTGDDIQALQSRNTDLKIAGNNKGNTSESFVNQAVQNTSNQSQTTSIQYAPPTASSSMIAATSGR